MSIDFSNCDFKGRATFAEVLWPDLTHTMASAEGSKFFSTATFSGNTPPPVQFFENAEFASVVTFSGVSERTIQRAFENELRAKDHAERPDIAQSHAASLENGCRTLRKLAEARGDVHGEHFWHRSELIARRARGESSRSEKTASVLYWLLADYGLSISRPFLALVGVILLFSAFYGWLGGDVWVGATFDVKSLEEGFGYSLNRTFPIGVFADDESPWRAALLGKSWQVEHAPVRLLATVQSIVSAILIYLGVMAIRRKFRIS